MGFIRDLLSSIFNPNKSTAEIGQPSKTWQDEVDAVVKETPVVTVPKVPPTPDVVMHIGGDPVVNGVELHETEMTKKSIINDIIAVEGGYVDHSSDLGGETNYGITYATANKATTKKKLVAMGWDGKMRNLTKEMAYVVYEIEYWNRMNLDAIFAISPFLADKLFDQGVNVGVTRSAKWLQRALNAFNRRQKDYKDIIADGGIGNETMKALNAFIAKRGRGPAVTVLLYALVGMQANHYITISEEREANEDFTFGWFMERLSHNIRLYFDKK